MKTIVSIILLNILFVFALQYLYLDSNFYYDYYRAISYFQDIENLEMRIKGLRWIGYFVIISSVILRMFFTTVFLYIGVFFTNLKVEFGKLFKVALLADFVFVLAAFAKLVILIFFKEVSTLEDLQFQPLSVMELLNSGTVDPLFVYPLNLLNIFELGYFFVLGWLLVPVLNEANWEQPVKFGRSLQIAAASYGSGLLLWVLLVMFLTLNMS